MRKHGKKLLSLVLALIMVFGLIPVSATAATPTSGSCGTNLTWTLDADGKLTISGTGKMMDYSDSAMVPWFKQRAVITSVVINEGVTSVGWAAFFNYPVLTSVTCPNSLISIGDSAFWGCVSLTSVTIGNSVTSIGAAAFQGCSGLTSIAIPASVTSIGAVAFSGSLTDVYYSGTEAQWKAIDISSSSNDPLAIATIHYNSTAPSTGTDIGTGPTPTPDPDPIPVALPDLGTASIQEEISQDGTDSKVLWVDHLKLPQYAQELYTVMTGDESSNTDCVFQAEKNFVLPQESTGPAVIQVERIDVAEFNLLDLYANPGSELNSAIFSDENFYTISANAEDTQIDCAALEVGELVATANFNGVYVTKIPYDNSYGAKKKETCEYIAAVYHAFDRDHPEIFWLSGKCKARIIVASDLKNSAKDAYFFLELADKDGFTMCAPAWTAAGSIAAGIQRRDAAVAGIIKTVTASDTVGKIKQINKWLTENNQYNTTADLTTIGNEPHECLAALAGKIGNDGPVCDGYSRAFKVLCDRLDIPCVLETGWARASKTGEAEFHMWSLVQAESIWYGADITWDDPSVKGFVGAKSGRENENYLLVGADTLISGMTFRESHIAKNQAAVGGVDFGNGPALSSGAFGGLPTVENIPAAGTAVARTQNVLLDGKTVQFQYYAVKNAAGNETNYVKIRDLAQALNGTKAQFNVGWDGKISITSNTPYQAVGGEGSTPYTGDQPYKTVSSTPVSFNGSSVNLTSFQLKDSAGNGYTYYKLRDLGQLLNFNVTWNGSSIVVESDKPYTG